MELNASKDAKCYSIAITSAIFLVIKRARTRISFAYSRAVAPLVWRITRARNGATNLAGIVSRK